MTSSIASAWSVHVHAGRDHVVARPGTKTRLPVRVEPGRPLVVEVRGVAPNEPVVVAVGSDEQELTTSQEGVVRWSPSHLLDATAGVVPLQVMRLDGEALSLSLDVKPSKLAEQSLRALLDDLDALAPGLSADLGGAGLTATDRHAQPEALLQLMEEVTGVVAEATAQIRMHPLHKVKQRVTAVPASAPRMTAPDVRWLCQHPADELRARSTGREAAVHREIRRDLDVAENRGAVGVLGHLRTVLDGLDDVLEQDRYRIEAGRAAREAFRTDRGNLFQERDVPRLRAITARRERIGALTAEVRRAYRRTGLPRSVPAGELHRSDRVESHPGYWGLYRVAQLVRGVRAPSASPVLHPVRNLDELYETWCAIQMASALAAWAGTSLGKVLRLESAGWFVKLPQGEIARVQRGDREFRLLYEPLYPFRGDGLIVKLHHGRPWAPDLVIEERAAGQPVTLHVFDAKHRIDPTRRDRLPVDALREVWFKYPDSIGFRETMLPAVASAWILYPGPEYLVRLHSPQMLSDDWPPDRVRGGAVSLVPGAGDAVKSLQRLLGVLLQ